MRPRLLGHYPPEPVHATRRTSARDPLRERERLPARLARAEANSDRDDPAAVIYLAGQAVTVRVSHGALRIGVLTGDDENHLFGDAITIPVEFEIDDQPVALVNSEGPERAAADSVDGHATVIGPC